MSVLCVRRGRCGTALGDMVPPTPYSSGWTSPIRVPEYVGNGVSLTEVSGRQVNDRYRILERYVTVQNLNAKVLVRVGLDQLIFAPPNIVVFFTAQSLMEGATLQEIQAKLKRT